MDKDIENELRRALASREPPAGFADRVLARLPGDGTSAPAPRKFTARPARWLSVALAASLVAVVVIRQAMIERDQQQQGERARQQVIDALRLTSAKLDIAYRAVQQEPASGSDEAERL